MKITVGVGIPLIPRGDIFIPSGEGNTFIPGGGDTFIPGGRGIVLYPREGE